MFNQSENEGTQRVAVLGSAVLDNLGIGSPEGIVGEPVRIKGIQFTVVGVLASKGQGTPFGNPDDQVRMNVAAEYEAMGMKDLADKERKKIKPAAPGGMGGMGGINLGGAGGGSRTIRIPPR